MSDARKILTGLFWAGVDAALPDTVLPGHFPPFPKAGRLIILASGKAAAAMAKTALDHYGATGEIIGHVTTRHGYGAGFSGLPLLQAGHPVPDAHSLTAARTALDLAAQAGPDDLVLVLLSGGASALWCAPCCGLSLAQKTKLTAHLLASGHDISVLNLLRRSLSKIKGGQLAAMAAPARVVTLAVCDVSETEATPADRLPELIGSGPTVAAQRPAPDFAALNDALGLALPKDILAALKSGNNPPIASDSLGKNSYKICASSKTALNAAALKAKALGLCPIVLEDDQVGTARDIAAAHMRLVLDLRAKARTHGKRYVLLSGGEATVKVRGTGRGGPNQEFVLAAAIALDGLTGVSVLAADTDGTDGGSGAASDPAGAFADETTLARARQRGLSARAELTNNNATGFFENLDDVLLTGPIHTNVNDFRAILVDP